MSYTQNRLYACICSLFIPVNSLSGSPIAGTCEGTHPQSTVKESRELAPSDDLPSPKTNYIQFQTAIKTIQHFLIFCLLMFTIAYAPPPPQKSYLRVQYLEDFVWIF